jgi:hypothetical protein
VAFPRRTLKLRSAFGSGLSRRRGDPPGTVWAICDRGPNLKLEDAVDYGWRPPPGFKIMPRPDIGPAISDQRPVVHSSRIQPAEVQR